MSKDRSNKSETLLKKIVATNNLPRDTKNFLIEIEKLVDEISKSPQIKQYQKTLAQCNDEFKEKLVPKIQIFQRNITNIADEFIKNIPTIPVNNDYIRNVSNIQSLYGSQPLKLKNVIKISYVQNNKLEQHETTDVYLEDYHYACFKAKPGLNPIEATCIIFGIFPKDQSLFDSDMSDLLQELISEIQIGKLGFYILDQRGTVQLKLLEVLRWAMNKKILLPKSRHEFFQELINTLEIEESKKQINTESRSHLDVSRKGGITSANRHKIAQARARELAEYYWNEGPDNTKSEVAEKILIIFKEENIKNNSEEYVEDTIMKWIKPVVPAANKKGGRPKKLKNRR